MIGQFLVAILLTLFVADIFAKRGATAVLVPCLLLWTHLYTLGMLNEGLPNAVRFEMLRLFVVVPVAMFALNNAVVVNSVTLWVIVASYILVSFLCLKKS